MTVSHKGGSSGVFGVCIPSGKRLELYWIRGSTTITTWTEEAAAMSNKAASLKRQRGRRTCGGIAYIARNKEIKNKTLSPLFSLFMKWMHKNNPQRKSWPSKPSFAVYLPTGCCGSVSCEQRVWLLKHFTNAHLFTLGHRHDERRWARQGSAHVWMEHGNSAHPVRTGHYAPFSSWPE